MPSALGSSIRCLLASAVAVWMVSKADRGKPVKPLDSYGPYVSIGLAGDSISIFIFTSFFKAAGPYNGYFSDSRFPPRPFGIRGMIHVDQSTCRESYFFVVLVRLGGLGTNGEAKSISGFGNAGFEESGQAPRFFAKAEEQTCLATPTSTLPP